MCASFIPASASPFAGAAAFAQPTPAPAAQQPLFSAFSPHVFSQALARRVPVFLLIGETRAAFNDPSLRAQLSAQTVPAQLLPGQRPDVELLCQRAAALFSGEGALPLCALLLENGLPFLAAPLPPEGFSLDAQRLLVWLTHAGRRFAQNRAAFARQAQDVLRSFSAPSLTKPYLPKDAAHDLLRSILAAQDSINGGFGKVKAPHVPLLRFLSHQASGGNRDAYAALDRALQAMKTGALHDPVDGLYFRATLTQDWRVFIPEKPLCVNALIAMTLMENGERGDALRMLSALADHFSLPGGFLAPALRADKSRYTFTPEQVCALLGSEEGLRACRLLGLLRQHRSSDPAVAPSRFSPPPPPPGRPSLDAPKQPLAPVLPPDLTAEDAAFLRRVWPVLARGRAARTSEAPVSPMLTMDAALAAAVLAACGQRTGESRFTQSALRTVHALLSTMPDASMPGALPAVSIPRPVPAASSCGAAAALSLALLTLARDEPGGALAATGLRLLGSTLHAFVRPDGMVMHTPANGAAFFPRVPAIFDGELPSPAALLVHALRAAKPLRPDAPYGDAIDTIYAAAAPYLKHEPMACAGLIDAINRASTTQ